MAITENEEKLIESGFVTVFSPESPENTVTAKKAITAWEQLLLLMKKENNYSNLLGSSVLDWQIENWANELTDLLHNTEQYEDLIKVNEQILQIDWKNSSDPKLIYENAKRDIADVYAYMGNTEKAYELYNEYLENDPLWGWGWIGYYRLLNDNNAPEFTSVIEQLYEKIKSNVHFRDMEDLCQELSYEFDAIGESDKSKYLEKRYEQEQKKISKNSAEFFNNVNSTVEKSSALESRKIYPNEPCPCGSGKKYKKCCGRN